MRRPGAALGRHVQRLVSSLQPLYACAVAAITSDHMLRASSGLPKGLSGKGSACQCRRRVGSLGWEGSLEEGMETHSSILA